MNWLYVEAKIIDTPTDSNTPVTSTIILLVLFSLAYKVRDIVIAKIIRPPKTQHAYFQSLIWNNEVNTVNVEKVNDTTKKV